MKNTILNKPFFAIATVLIFSIFAFGFKKAAETTPSKITICHTPPGNPGNCQEISVSLNALQAHLDHGDDLVCHDSEERNFYDHLCRVQRERDPSSPITVRAMY